MIEKSVLLHCNPEEAFRLFTVRISEWWPHTHRPAKDPDSELVLEQTGRFSQIAADGREIALGRVLDWEPPHRLALDFYIGTNEAQPTAVEVTFTPAKDGTRVTIQHRSKPESQDLWNQRAPLFERSWEAVLSALSDR